MKILALDQASKVSGWSLYDGGELISYGHWTNEQADVAVRIYKLCEQLRSKIRECEPDLIILENIQQERGNVSVFQTLAWVQGALMMVAQEFGIKCELVYPSDWRSECGLLKGLPKDRANQKRLAQAWVLEKFNKKCTQDEADAICIGYSRRKKTGGGAISFK